MCKSGSVAKKRNKIAAEQENCCYYCGGKMNLSMTKKRSPKKATVEHLLKKADGGTLRYENIVVACQQCNCNRGDYPVKMWKAICKEVIAIRKEEKSARKRPGGIVRKATKGMEQPARSGILRLCSAHASKFIIPAIREKYWQMEKDVVYSYLQTQQETAKEYAVTGVFMKAKTIYLSAKCSDLCSTMIYDANGDSIGSEALGYAPSFMPDDGGDYIDLEIDINTGKILNWKVPSEQELSNGMKSSDLGWQTNGDLPEPE